MGKKRRGGTRKVPIETTSKGGNRGTGGKTKTAAVKSGAVMAKGRKPIKTTAISDDTHKRLNAFLGDFEKEVRTSNANIMIQLLSNKHYYVHLFLQIQDPVKDKDSGGEGREVTKGDHSKCQRPMVSR